MPKSDCSDASTREEPSTAAELYSRWHMFRESAFDVSAVQSVFRGLQEVRRLMPKGTGRKNLDKNVTVATQVYPRRRPPMALTWETSLRRWSVLRWCSPFKSRKEDKRR